MESINSVLETVYAYLNVVDIVSAIRAFLLLSAGYLLGKFASRSLDVTLSKYFGEHQVKLVRRAVYYTIFLLFFISALREIGFSLQVLLGAAGIFSVAIGFASQTSVSNLISGLFLIAERPFIIGDLIKVGNQIGKVHSIDLLSVKLVTFDNRYIRIPNETLIKSEVVTLTKYPIRRIDMKLGVAYKENLERVRDILKGIANDNPLCLDNPEPIFIIEGFGSSSLELQFSFWVKNENFLDLRNSMYIEIKKVFDREGIEIPFPHISLYVGSTTEPFPLEMRSGDPGSKLPSGKKKEQ